MKNLYFMTIDLGTSYIKAGVYDTEGTCLMITQSSIHSDNSKPGIFVQRGEEIFNCVLSCMKRITDTFGEKSKQIAAIGFTGQMAGFMGVDRDWNDITSWSCSLDTRYVPYAEKQMEKFGNDFLEISGTNAPLMAPKCEWFVTEFPKEAKHIAKYMLISSYIIGKLGNCKIEDAVVDCSYTTWTGLVDVKKEIWSDELCRKAGISRDLLPKIVKSNEVCAYLDPKIADAVGLKSGIPLVSGAGDKIAGCIGSGILNMWDMIFEASSYGAISSLVDGYRPNRETKDYDAIPEFRKGNFYIHKYIPGSGITLQWFLDTFADGYPDWKNAFSVIEDAAKSIPCGSDGLMAVGLLGGSAMPFDGDLKGAWTGYTWSHKKEHFYKALLESYSYELKLTIDSMKKMYPEWKDTLTIKMIGGGANSAIWPQILSDTTGCEFVLLDRDDVALWGTAILTGSGIGIFGDMKETANRTVKITKQIRPNLENYRKYQEYLKMYSVLKENVHNTCAELKHVL